MGLHQLSATLAAEMIRQKEISPVELVEALLQRIDALEPSIKAWVMVDRDGALAAARRCEQEIGKVDPGPLYGVPVGVKDIFHAAGLPTTCGSPIFQNRIAPYDATSVARLREAGAIVLGKTVTVQFAHFDPPPTRNPWNHLRTPGGSSSGTAAAVASQMVAVGLGSQTGGSILRPAAYCGTVGLKPTYGRISRFGVAPASWSLDHVGHLTRSVADAALLLQVMAGHDSRDKASATAAVGNYLQAAKGKDKAPRLGLVLDEEGRAQPEVAAHVAQIASRFEKAGAEILEVRFPTRMSELIAIRSLICEVESSALHAHLHRERAEDYGREIRALVEIGQLVPGPIFIQAQRLRRKWRPQVEKMFHGVDCLLMPTVYNVAPDTSTTGDSSFQAVWSLFGQPSICLPSGLSQEGLPLSVQLVAPAFEEETLLSAAAWCEAVLDPMPSPC